MLFLYLLFSYLLCLIECHINTIIYKQRRNNILYLLSYKLGKTAGTLQASIFYRDLEDLCRDLGELCRDFEDLCRDL